jgi:hypothetical protein
VNLPLASSFLQYSIPYSRYISCAVFPATITHRRRQKSDISCVRCCTHSKDLHFPAFASSYEMGVKGAGLFPSASTQNAACAMCRAWCVSRVTNIFSMWKVQWRDETHVQHTATQDTDQCWTCV